MGRVLSIEVGALGLKVCVIRRKRIERSFEVSVPRGSVTPTEILDVDNIALLLRQELKSNRIRVKECIVSINSTQIYGRYVTIPKQMGTHRTLSVLRSKVVSESIFPISLEGNIISYLSLGYETKDLSNADIKRGSSDKVQMEKMLVYLIPESLVVSINKLVSYARLQLKCIEYSGNAVCQYVKTRESTDSYIIVDINDMNCVITAVSDNCIYYQRHTDYGYQTFTSKLLEEKEVFGVSTVQDALDLIKGTNFLDRENHTMLEHLPSDISQLDKNIVTRVQNELIEKVLSFLDNMQSFLTQCRVVGNPAKIVLVNERDGFTDIIESLEYTLSLSVKSLDVEDIGGYIVPCGAVIQPINFNIANEAKARLKKVARYILLIEGVAVFCACLSYTVYSYFRYIDAVSENEYLKVKIEEASEAQLVYQGYLRSIQNNEEVRVFDSSSSSILNSLDIIIEYLESSIPRGRLRISPLSGDTSGISFSVEADSKDTIVRFIQELESIEFFDTITYNAVSESDSDDFDTGRLCTMSFSCSFKTVEQSDDIRGIEEGVNSFTE